MDDRQIIAWLFARDEQALEAVKTTYGDLCRTVAYNILRDERDTEECVNDAFLALWNAVPPTKPHSLKSFLCRITRNAALKKLEYTTAQKRNPALLVSLSELDELLPDTRVEEQVQAKDLARLISRFLEKENPDARRVFVRRYWLFESVEEIAHYYGFTQSKVKNLLYHTRNRLRRYLQQEGVTM